MLGSRIGGRFDNIHHHKGMGYYLDGKIKLAHDEFLIAEAEGCQQAKTYFYLGKIKLDYGHEELALSYFEKAYSLDQYNPKIWLALGVVLTSLKHYERAEGFFDELVKNSDADILLHRANLFFCKAEHYSEFSDSESKKIANDAALETRTCFTALVKMEAITSDEKLNADLIVKQLLAVLTLIRLNHSSYEAEAEKIKMMIAQLNGQSLTMEDLIILFVAQCRLKNYVNSSYEHGNNHEFKSALTLIQEIFKLTHSKENPAESIGLYNSIPAYLKRVFFEEIVCWPDSPEIAQAVAKQLVASLEDVKRLKGLIIELLSTPVSENRTIHLMQVNAALISLTPTSLFGSILHIARGSLTPTWAGGSLAELVRRIEHVVAEMNADERGLKICQSTVNALTPLRHKLEKLPHTHWALFGTYPEIYIAFVGSQPSLAPEAPIVMIAEEIAPAAIVEPPPPVSTSWFGFWWRSSTTQPALAAQPVVPTHSSASAASQAGVMAAHAGIFAAQASQSRSEIEKIDLTIPALMASLESETVATWPANRPINQHD